MRKQLARLREHSIKITNISCAGTKDSTQFPKEARRVTTVTPLGREIVGLFSAARAKWYQVGFITRLRMGDYSWRPKGSSSLGGGIREIKHQKDGRICADLAGMESGI